MFSPLWNLAKHEVVVYEVVASIVVYEVSIIHSVPIGSPILSCIGYLTRLFIFKEAGQRDQEGSTLAEILHTWSRNLCKNLEILVRNLFGIESCVNP